ncbi:hypothetical protein ACIBK1_37290 [Microbispora rosea]|uniref:hypothetical protein n=1 Tax=Microbispora rosea TaxID=58117 RepID=UPI0037BBD60C
MLEDLDTSRSLSPKSLPMDNQALTRFGELVQAAAELRPLELAELHEIGGVLSEVILTAAALAIRVEAESATLGKRYVLRDTTGDTDPEARLAEVRQRMRRMVDLLHKADLHARRSHAAINRIVQTDPDAATGQRESNPRCQLGKPSEITPSALGKGSPG